MSSRNTTAVITLVMLAIERLSCAFSSQSTWPVSGLKMMAAAARMSGTSAPVASVLYRGVIASWSACEPGLLAGPGGRAGTREAGLAGLRGRWPSRPAS